MCITIRAVLLRILLVGLFLSGYATVWHPVREWISDQVMATSLKYVDTPRASNYVISSARPDYVEIQTAKGKTPVAGMKTPTGALFVIGGVFLLTLFPTRFYWVYIAIAQWLLAGLMLGMLAVGIGWTSWGFVIHNFLRSDIYQAISLGLPILFVWLESRSENSESEPSTSP